MFSGSSRSRSSEIASDGCGGKRGCKCDGENWRITATSLRPVTDCVLRFLTGGVEPPRFLHLCGVVKTGQRRWASLPLSARQSASVLPKMSACDGTLANLSGNPINQSAFRKAGLLPYPHNTSLTHLPTHSHTLLHSRPFPVTRVCGITTPSRCWHPTPLCESNTKVPKFNGNNTDRCSDRGGGGWKL